MTTPDTLFELDMDVPEERRVLKQTEVPGLILLAVIRANTVIYRTRRCRSAGIAGLSSEVFS